MALFYRRVVQRELDFLRQSVFDTTQLKDILTRLNGRERQALTAEWEVVLLGCFAVYPRDFPNARVLCR